MAYRRHLDRARRARRRREQREHTKKRRLKQSNLTQIEPLLVDVLRQGELVYDFPTIDEIRQQRRQDLERLDAGVKRIMTPHIYHVSLSHRLWTLKQELIGSVTESS